MHRCRVLYAMLPVCASSLGLPCSLTSSTTQALASHVHPGFRIDSVLSMLFQGTQIATLALQVAFFAIYVFYAIRALMWLQCHSYHKHRSGLAERLGDLPISLMDW